MSGLAQIMNNMGFTIQGSDLNRNKNIERLIKSKIKISIGHHQRNLHKANWESHFIFEKINRTDGKNFTPTAIKNR